MGARFFLISYERRRTFRSLCCNKDHRDFIVPSTTPLAASRQHRSRAKPQAAVTGRVRNHPSERN